MKHAFTTGLVMLLPIALTLWVISYLLDLFTSPLFHVVEEFLLQFGEKNHISWLHLSKTTAIISRLLALLLSLLVILGLGFAARRLFLDSVLTVLHRFIIKVPFIGTIYRLTKDLTKAMLGSDKKAFKQTVLIPFPGKNSSYTLGLVTGEIPPFIHFLIPDMNMTVFVPTAPHPISGYLLFCNRSSLQTLDISVEETFKFLVSCGTLYPCEKKNP